MKKKFLGLILTLLLVAPLWANQGVTDKEIKIGAFLPLSGVVGFVGQGVQVGMDTYAKYYNAELASKVGDGKTFNIVFFDDQFKAEKSVDAAKELINNHKVFAIVGAVGTPGILATMDLIAKTGIPFVYQGSGVKVLFDPPKRNVFPVQPAFVFEGVAFVKFVADFLDKKNIVYVYQSDAGVVDAGKECLEGMKKAMDKYKRKGVKLIGEITYSSTDPDFKPVATRIKELNPDVVVLFAYGGAAIAVVKAARDAGMDLIKTPFLTTYVNSDPVFFSLGGASWNDVYVGAWASPTEGDYFKNFMRVWKQYSGSKRDPSPYNIAGWIAMETFTEGIKRLYKRFGGKLTWDNYIKAMETFNENGGWKEGMAYRLSYKPFNPSDPSTRYPQAYLYFIVGKEKKYQIYKKAKSLEDLFIYAAE